MKIINTNKIVKINKCSECPWCEKLFPNKSWSDYICTYFEPDQLIVNTGQILECCELGNGKDE